MSDSQKIPAQEHCNNNNSDGELVPTELNSVIDYTHDDNISLKRESWGNIFKELLFNIIPDSLTISFGYFSGLIVLLANFAFIGRNSDANALAAVGLGNVWISFVGINIIFGLNYGFETMASRVWGAGKPYMMGIYLKKTIILNVFTMFCCFCVLLHTKEILIYLGQDEQISGMTYSYVIAMYPGSLFLTFYDLLIMFLNAQNLFKPAMFIQIITTILHFLFCYIFVEVFSWNIIGIAYATNLTQTLNFLLIMLYLTCLWPERKTFTWGPSILSKPILSANWYKFLLIALPISLSIILEYASFEINSVIAGLLKSNTTFAAHLALSNAGSVIYCIPEGFSTAIITFVGNAVGENKKFKAQKYAILGNISGLLVLLLVIVLLFSTKNFWPEYFSENQEVSDKIRQMLILFSVMLVMDTLQMNLSAVLKALGKQNLTVLIYFICLYLIANPLSYWLGITKQWDLEGIWYGIIFGNLLMALLFFIILARLKWDEEIINCRAAEDKEEITLKNLENDVSVITGTKGIIRRVFKNEEYEPTASIEH